MSYTEQFDEIFKSLNRIERLAMEAKSVKSDKSYNGEERLTRAEVSKQFKISLPTIHKLMLEDNMPFEKIGSNTRFKRADIEAYFSSKRRVSHGR